MNEIDEVLKALGGVEAPAGLEERVLRRLAAVPERRPWFTGWRVAGVGALVMAAVVMGVVMVPRRVLSPVVQAPVAEAGHVAVEPGAMPKPTISAGVAMPKVAGRTVKRAWVAVEVAPAKADRTMSFPAPPMALTDQERALMEIARSKDLPKFAPMNPENRDELIAQSKAEFDKFFPKPAPQESYYEAPSLDR